MPIEGSLREFAVEDVFQLLHLSRKTGELLLVREPSGTEGSVMFDTGAVVGASLESTSLDLGHLLLTAGKITESDLERAHKKADENPGTAMSDILKSLALASPSEIEKYARFQVEEAVYEILEWSDGRFSFRERSVDESEAVTWLPTESLLMEGARRADELSAMPAGADSANSIPRLADEAAEGGVLDLSPTDWEVLARVDGESDVKSIAWALGRSEFEVSKVVSKLVELGLLELAAPDSNRTKPPHIMALEEVEHLLEAGELDPAAERVNRVLSDHPDEPRAHLLAARLAEETGDLRAAAHGYEKTLSYDPLAEDARLHLGLVRLKLGDLSGAQREWTAYLRMAQDTPERRRVERAMSAVHELQVVLSEFDGRERT